MESLLDLILSGLVAAICVASGRGLLLRLGFHFANTSEELALSAGVGFGTLIYSMVLLGVAGLYRTTTAWSVLAALSLFGIWEWRRKPWRLDLKQISRWLQELPWPLAVLLVLMVAYVLGYLLVALAPTLEGDSLAGYLLTAREYAQRGGLVSVDHAYTNSYPANGQMISTLGFLIRGQILAQLLIVWIMGLLALLTIYSLGRKWLSRRAALVGMASWYGTGSVGYLAASGKIDLAWASFDLLALLAFSRWYFERGKRVDWRWLALAGFFLGIASGAKHASALTAILLAVAIALRLWRTNSGRSWEWRQSYAALGLPAALAGLWLARSYIMTGSLAFAGEKLRGDEGVSGFFRTLWGMSMLGNASSIEGPLGKPIGPVIMALVPLLLFFRNVERRVWIILAFCGLMIVLWFNSVQRARHILPTLAILSLLAGYVVVVLLAERTWVGTLIVASIIVTLVLNLGAWGYVNLVSLHRLSYVIGLHNLDRYLATNLPKSRWLPNHAMVTYSHDHLPEEAHIASLTVGGHGYYMDRPIYASWNQTPEEVPDPTRFVSKMRAAGMTHVFVNELVINVHELQDAWLANSEFQRGYLDQLICNQGQCLYSLDPSSQ